MKSILGLLAVSCWLSGALAGQPAFDAREVASQVRNAARLTFDGGEFLIDTTGAGLEPDLEPAVAFDGTNFLVVWQHFVIGDYADIYGARVNQAGIVLDPAGIAISTADSGKDNPTVAFDGTNFLVTWEDYRNGFYSDIYGARVTPAGAVLDTSGIAISTALEFQGHPSVAFDGTNSFVVWEDYRSGWGYDVYGARVTPTGTVLDTSGIVVSIARGGHESPAIAFDGTNYLVVWREGYWGVNGSRVTPGGLVLDPTGIAITTTAYWLNCPAVAFGGTNSLVVWEDGRNSPDSADIYGARVSQAGIVLDSAGIAISTAAHYQLSPAVVSDGTNSLVAWQDERSDPDTSDIYGARVTAGGAVLDEFPVVMQEGGQYYPALCRGPGSQMILVYQGWAGTVGGKTYNVDRIWGKMNPVPRIEETMNDERGTMNAGPTILRGVLNLQSAIYNLQSEIALLDISGRNVLALHPGPNDVSRLAPGVYFVRAVSRKLSAASCRKVMIAR